MLGDLSNKEIERNDTEIKVVAQTETDHFGANALKRKRAIVL